MRDSELAAVPFERECGAELVQNQKGTWRFKWKLEAAQGRTGSKGVIRVQP